MLSPKKLLENARNRIAKRENWTNVGYVATREDRSTTTLNPDATCWCAYGALAAEAGVNTHGTGDTVRALSGHPYSRDAMNALIEAAEQISPKNARAHTPSLVWWINDVNGHEDTLKMFDLAIASLKGE